MGSWKAEADAVMVPDSSKGTEYNENHLYDTIESDVDFSSSDCDEHRDHFKSCSFLSDSSDQDESDLSSSSPVFMGDYSCLEPRRKGLSDTEDEDEGSTTEEDFYDSEYVFLPPPQYKRLSARSRYSNKLDFTVPKKLMPSCMC